MWPLRDGLIFLRPGEQSCRLQCFVPPTHRCWNILTASCILRTTEEKAAAAPHQYSVTVNAVGPPIQPASVTEIPQMSFQISTAVVLHQFSSQCSAIHRLRLPWPSCVRKSNQGLVTRDLGAPVGGGGAASLPTKMMSDGLLARNAECAASLQGLVGGQPSAPHCAPGKDLRWRRGREIQPTRIVEERGKTECPVS